jgi:hypothetical protein
MDASRAPFDCVSPADAKDPVTQRGPEEGSGRMGQAEIDKNLAEPFQASDAPSWTLGANHKEEPPRQQDENQLPGEGAEYLGHWDMFRHSGELS